MILFPAIDLKDGKCVRLTQGDFNQSTIYNSSPIDQAKIFQDLGVEWVHCVDLDGALHGVSENSKFIEQIAKETNLNIQVGGGIRTKEKVISLIDIGVSNLIFGTAVFEDREFFDEMVKLFPHTISIALDLKNNQIATKGWSETYSLDLKSFLTSLENMKVNSIICTDIERDGMKKGINHDMLCEVMKYSEIPLVASGGVSSLEDIKDLKNQNYRTMKGVIVGKAIYDKNLNLEDALELLK